MDELVFIGKTVKDVSVSRYFIQIDFDDNTAYKITDNRRKRSWKHRLTEIVIDSICLNGKEIISSEIIEKVETYLLTLKTKKNTFNFHYFDKPDITEVEPCSSENEEEE